MAENRFDPLDNMAVRDRTTGLEWTRNANPFDFPLTWNEAREACAALSSSDPRFPWRLPNRRELLSLISFAHANPALPDGHPFSNVPSVALWSSTRVARNESYRWYVQLSGGRMFYHQADSSVPAWPVRGQSNIIPVTGRNDEPLTGRPWPQPRFLPGPTPAIILDRLTGLHWTRQAGLGQKCLWTEALARVTRLNTEAHQGLRSWRLPTIRELESLTDASRHDPALPDAHPFLDWRETYWSATSSGLDPNWAMCLYLDKGAVGVGFKQGPERFAVWACADS
ncbi:MAG: DUF1566 domain-containing protein [Desulfovibrionaceae bacterium]